MRPCGCSRNEWKNLETKLEVSCEGARILCVSGMMAGLFDLIVTSVKWPALHSSTLFLQILVHLLLIASQVEGRCHCCIHVTEKETEAWHGNHFEQGPTVVISELGVRTQHCSF